MELSAFLRPLSSDDRHQIAAKCGTTRNHLRNVAFSGKVCGPHLAVALDRVSGGRVRRWDLRPSDWHLIWPELIGADGAPPIPTTQPEEARNAA